MSFDNLSSLMRTSESFSDLNAESNPLRSRITTGTTVGVAPSAGAGGGDRSTNSSTGKSGSSNSGNSSTTLSTLTSEQENNATVANKPFGLGKVQFSYR